MLFLKGKLSSDRLIKNTGWMLSAEAFSKVSRLLTVFFMAAYLSFEDYGSAALVIACFELIRIFSRAGAGAKVIQCAESEVVRYAQNAVLIQWLVCACVAFFQIIIAVPISNFYENTSLGLLLILIAPTYLLYPIVSSKVFFTQRSNRLKQYSLGIALSLSAENIAVVIALILGGGVYSIAIGKVVASVTWVLYFLTVRESGVAPKYHRKTFNYLLKYAGKIFFIDLVKSLRSQVDVLIAAKVISPESLGIYSFAKNAGVGMSQSIVIAYSSSLYPYFCEKIRSGSKLEILKKSIKTSLFVSLLFLAQALVAPFYVSILFDEIWHTASTVVSILCLTAISMVIVETVTMYFRAMGQSYREIITVVLCFMSTGLLILLLTPNDAQELAQTVLLSSLLWVICAVLPFLNVRKMLKQRNEGCCYE